MAAFRTVVSGGFIPQAKQGDKSVAELALAGSKCGDTGLEKEHIGHIHIAFAGLGDGLCPTRGSPPARPLFFGGLGYSTIFGDDLRNPALYE